jgi:hypothetical protein
MGFYFGGGEGNNSYDFESHNGAHGNNVAFRNWELIGVGIIATVLAILFVHSLGPRIAFYSGSPMLGMRSGRYFPPRMASCNASKPVPDRCAS